MVATEDELRRQRALALFRDGLALTMQAITLAMKIEDRELKLTTATQMLAASTMARSILTDHEQPEFKI